MGDLGQFDSSTWVSETGASTGDRRENSPKAAGFTDDDDRLFRSHFQRANRLVDRADEYARPVREVVHADVDPARQGRVPESAPIGTTPSHDRVSYADPLAGGIDPTSPAPLP